MLDNLDIIEAKQILKEIEDFEPHFKYYLYESRTGDILQRLHRDLVFTKLENRFANYNLKIQSGATRLVLCFLDKYVLKTNLYEPEYDEWCQRYVDYSFKEYETYQKACQNNVNECFAECQRLDDNEYRSWYIMEYCAPDEEYVIDSALRLEYGDDYEDDDEYYEDDSEEMAMTFLCDRWGSDIFHNFDDFKWDFNVNDIHTANIGLDLDGKWKVIDYASYFG